MRVAAEFLCSYGDSDSTAGPGQVRDQQGAYTSQRRWLVKEVYIDREGMIVVDQWSVRYYVDYTCSAGEYSV